MQSDSPIQPRSRAEATRLLLNPASVVVIGATEDLSKFGGRLCKVLVELGYKGRLYPVNPRRKELFGRPAFPDLASVPETPEVAVVVLPPAHVLPAVEACAARGVPAAIIISSGFAETGDQGLEQQEVLARIATTTGPRLVGPNCLGLINTLDRVVECSTMAFDRGEMLTGPVSIVSHSGALMMTILDRARDQGMGFRYLISAGNEADLDACDFLEVFLEDPETRVVTAVLEHIRRPARFRELAQYARQIGKPIVAMKIGRSAAGVRAARSHTAAVAGDDAVIDSVLRADGILRVTSLEALIDTAQALALAPKPQGQGVLVLSTSGGVCGFLADLAADAGLQLAELSEAGRKALEPLYEPAALNNPLDLGAMRAGIPIFHPDVVDKCLEGIGCDPNVHGLVVGFVTQPWIIEDAQRIIDFARRWGRPVVIYGGVGGVGLEALDLFRASGLPVITDAERCLRVARAVMEQSVPWPARVSPPAPPAAPPLPPGQGALTEVESKQILAAAGLPLPREAFASSPEEAARLASRFDGPVAMKVVSPDILHKTEAHGVRLGIVGAEAARMAYQEILAGAASAVPGARIEGVLIQEMVKGVEVIVGSKRDPQFGPVVLVGLGGVSVELLKDVSIRPAPVTADEACEMLAGLRGYPLLTGFRGAPPADVDALAELIASFSGFTVALADQVEEIDLNPVTVLPKGQGVRIVDALIVRRTS